MGLSTEAADCALHGPADHPETRAGVSGVNERDSWYDPPRPQAPENVQTREVLLVDRHGKPLLVKEPRPMGFRKP